MPNVLKSPAPADLPLQIYHNIPEGTPRLRIGKERANNIYKNNLYREGLVETVQHHKQVVEVNGHKVEVLVITAKCSPEETDPSLHYTGMRVITAFRKPNRDIMVGYVHDKFCTNNWFWPSCAAVLHMDASPYSMPETALPSQMVTRLPDPWS